MGASHHGGDHGHRSPGEEALMKRFIEQIENRAKRQYSQGRAGPTDDGDIAMAVSSDPGRGIVVIDFGKPVTWIGLGPKEVAGLVNLLVSKAREVAREPFTIDLGGEG